MPKPIPWTPQEDRVLDLSVLAGIPFTNMPLYLEGRTAAACQARHGVLADIKRVDEPTPVPTRLTPEAIGSRNLLRRQLQTGQHFIRTRAAFKRACEIAGLQA